MLVLVEGSDRAGKSSLVHAIYAKLGELYPGDRVELHHAGPPKAHPLSEYELPLLSYRPGQSHHIICDRWHVGETVYPLVSMRKTQLTPQMSAHIDAFLRSRGAVLVHAHAHIDALRERFTIEERDNPGQSSVNWQQLVTAHHLFMTNIPRVRLPLLSIDTTNSPSVTSLAADVIAFAHNVEREAVPLTSLRTYVGGPRPRLLLVGDVRHAYRFLHNNVGTLSLALQDPSPAFLPYAGTSGAFLLKSVPESALGDIGLINANDVDDAHLAWQTLGEPSTVALGRRAWSTVQRWAVGAVPHPQYVRRFHSSQFAWYGSLIMRAALGANLLSERPLNADANTNKE